MLITYPIASTCSILAELCPLFAVIGGLAAHCSFSEKHPAHCHGEAFGAWGRTTPFRLSHYNLMRKGQTRKVRVEGKITSWEARMAVLVQCLLLHQENIPGTCTALPIPQDSKDQKECILTAQRYSLKKTGIRKIVVKRLLPSQILYCGTDQPESVVKEDHILEKTVFTGRLVNFGSSDEPRNMW